MRKQLLPGLVAASLCTQCAKTPDPSPAIPVDYDQKSAKIVQALSPAVPGSWVLRRLFVKAQSHSTGHKELGIRRDTVFQDFATLSLRPAPSGRSVPDPRYATFAGLLRFRTKTYPVRFELQAAPEQLIYNRGPQGQFFLVWDFPFGSHVTEPEEHFLQYLGFINDNFSLELTDGQPAMTWRGLSRGIEKIELHRQ